MDKIDVLNIRFEWSLLISHFSSAKASFKAGINKSSLKYYNCLYLNV